MSIASGVRSMKGFLQMVIIFWVYRMNYEQKYFIAFLAEAKWTRHPQSRRQQETSRREACGIGWRKQRCADVPLGTEIQESIYLSRYLLNIMHLNRNWRMNAKARPV